MRNLQKHINYCYPTSQRAEQLGASGYFVAQRYQREDGSWAPSEPARGGDIFESLEDADLLQLLKETDGVYNPQWCIYHRNTGKLATTETDPKTGLQLLLTALSSNTVSEALDEIDNLKECRDWCDIYR